MAAKCSLKDYNAKPELSGTGRRFDGSVGSSNQPIYVIQKHKANRLHYDFRLEIDGVLKSWAVPKGPSTDPREKRLAVLTEDHPLEYAGFEGVIPTSEYGAGTVLLWDAGTYRNIKVRDGRTIPMAQALVDGHLVFWLAGMKVRGGYALIRLKGTKDENWLLVKMNDSEADPSRDPVETQPESVLSGRTIEEIAEEDAVPS